MNNGETSDLKRIGVELWTLFNSLKLSELNKLKEKIQEFNAYMGKYGGYDE